MYTATTPIPHLLPSTSFFFFLSLSHPPAPIPSLLPPPPFPFPFPSPLPSLQGKLGHFTFEFDMYFPQGRP